MSLQLNDETSRCVKCGLCLPECPTYQLTQNEAYSPRGRIALAAALNKKQVTADRWFLDRINSCLLCRRCEQLCPSGVRFGYIMDETRSHETTPAPFWQTLLNAQISNPVKLRRKLSFLQWLKPLIPAIPRLAPPMVVAQHYPAFGKKRGSVALFKGCTGEALEPQTLVAAIKLLNHAGQDVHIPKNQGCCGAIHAHAGDAQQALVQKTNNQQAFKALPADHLLSIVSGCGAHLADDPELPIPHLDICAYLVKPKTRARLHFKPLKALVAVHIPCSLENSLGSTQTVLDLLQCIPEIDLKVIGRGCCCGAAGTYFLTHKQTAEQLRRPLVQQIEETSPDFLVTSNIGCGMHLDNGLDKNSPKAIHPISLLARQLEPLSEPVKMEQH